MVCHHDIRRLRRRSVWVLPRPDAMQAGDLAGVSCVDGELLHFMLPSWLHIATKAATPELPAFAAEAEHRGCV
jgi:hypothetical protein